MFGPQTDLDRLPNWGRNVTTGGEDPYLSGTTFAPANDPTGYPVPSSALSRSNSTVTGNLARTGPGAANDSSLDFTTAYAAGRLAPGSY